MLLKGQRHWSLLSAGHTPGWEDAGTLMCNTDRTRHSVLRSEEAGLRIKQLGQGNRDTAETA